MKALILATFFYMAALGSSLVDCPEVYEQLRIMDTSSLPTSHPHKMRNIDFIYMINLDSRPEKWKTSLEQLAPYGILPYRVPAIVGAHLSCETLNGLGLLFDDSMQGGGWGTYYTLSQNCLIPHKELMKEGKRYFSASDISLGAIGCLLSHLSILEDAYQANYETIWVMEDDIEVLQDPHLLSSLIENLDDYVGEWDILFTDIDFRNREGHYVPCTNCPFRPNFKVQFPQRFHAKERLSPDFSHLYARFGAHSMILKRSGIEKILNFIKTYSIFLPIDLDYFLPSNIRLYSLNYDLVSNKTHALSDIDH